MSEIKPASIKTAQERFQAYMKAKGISLSSSLVHINKITQFEEQERKELRAAYEALQKENAELKHINLTSLADLHFKNRDLEDRNAAQAKRISELEETNGLIQTQVHCLEMVAASKNGE